MKRIFLIFLIILISLIGSSCEVAEDFEQVEYLIGVSQANFRDPWRLVLTSELEEEAAKHSNLRLVFTDAADDATKQAEDIEKLRGIGVDLLIVSPCDAKDLTPAISEAYEDIPVIVLDRMVEGFDYTLFIGPDNILAGQQAGNVVKQLSNGEQTTVLELAGVDKSNLDRSKGFGLEIETNSNITSNLIALDNASRDNAQDIVLKLQDQLEDIDIIFAHNDYMALGAYRALTDLGIADEIDIVGIDGFSGDDGGLYLVSNGTIEATITCPTGGKEAIQNAVDILNNVSGVPKQIILRSHTITEDTLEQYQQLIAQTPTEQPSEIVVGHVQVGTESSWRIANHNSISMAAKEAGITLVTSNADQSQQKQIDAIQEFIEQKVDAIVLSPVVSTGWDEVLSEAKEANIPILLSDRKIDTQNPNLYETFIGADFLEEGRRAMRWILDNVPPTDRKINILEIEGTYGASPTIERAEGFREILNLETGYEIIHSSSGDYTSEGGFDVISDYIKKHGGMNEVDVIFSHNDDMALGAISALETAGIIPGQDVAIISVDGTSDALEALEQGQLNCVVECSPLLGPQLIKAITDLMSGKQLPLRIITDEIVFTNQTPKVLFENRLY